MGRYSKDGSQFAWLIAGLAIGAAAMYIFDPVYGRRRRALLKDRVRGASVQSQRTVSAKVHDLSNRAQGLRVQAGKWLH